VACINSFSALRRDLVDLLLRNGSVAALPDKQGLRPYDYANPLVSAWIRGAIYPPPQEFYGPVPTLKHLTLTKLREQYIRMRETEGGRFLVTLADLDEKLLWSFVKPPVPSFRWFDAISDDEPKKLLLGNLIYRKLSIWDHESSSLGSCFSFRMNGFPGAQSSAAASSSSPSCSCLVSTMIRFRETGLSGQLQILLNFSERKLALHYGATGRDLLRHPALMAKFLTGLGLDPQQDQIMFVMICLSALPSIFLHLGTNQFQALLELARGFCGPNHAAPQWFLDAIQSTDHNRSLPLYLPPVAKRDNGVLITDSATFEVSSGKIQFIEPSFESRSSEDEEENSDSPSEDSENFSDHSESS
ncbi:MAG: hypothetical protein Q8P67_10220, partial [archaeon]|nr:hypothetical protein [archaeon]